MEENDASVEEGFYREVARLLDCRCHHYERFPYERRNRWNHRRLGNGRYPGHGIVRRFSAGMISVQLNSPRLSGVFGSAEEAISAIGAAVLAQATAARRDAGRRS